METIDLAGFGVIKVRRGSHIKRLSLRMAVGRGVWVCVPPGVGRRMVASFLEENREWLMRNREKVERREQEGGVGLGIGAEIATKLHVLKIEETAEREPSYRIEGKVFRLLIPKGMDFRRIEGIVGKFLVEVYRLEAKQYLPQRVRAYAERFGFKYEQVGFRNNVSNWGSCSYDNHISLNVKLMKLPDELIDYVILHELCHTVEKNHSAAFWRLMKSVCPDYLSRRKRLREYNTLI